MLAKTLKQTPGSRVGLTLIGGFSLFDKNGDPIRIPNRKACALLAYLALKPTGAESREKLAGLLWSERSEEQARASLRQCLKQLRGVFNKIGFKGLVSDRQSASLMQKLWSIDLHEVKNDLELGTVSPVLLSNGSVSEKILNGFESLDQAFSSWLYVERQNFYNNCSEVLQDSLRAKGGSAKKAAEALILLDPTHEEAYRYLMRQNVEDGNTAAALDHYERLWNLLEDEYDVEPSNETQDLIVEIKTGTFKIVSNDSAANDNPPHSGTFDEQGQTPLSAKSRTASIPVIGVGQFISHEGTSNDISIAANFRLEVIASLARFREWVVVDSRPDDKMSDYVLDGSSVRSGEKLVFILTLKELNSGRYIWSEKIDISTINWFEAFQKLIQQISLSLNVYLSAERLISATSGKQNRHHGYDQWLSGQNEMLYWNPTNEAKAEITLRNIIDEYPDFAPAYGCLAAVYNTKHLKNPGVFRNQQFVSEALRLSKVSVEIDPLDSRNQLALAWSHAMNSRFDQAEIFFGLAYELNPNSPTTMIPCAQGLSYCGDRQRARQVAETAVALNPAMAQFQWGYVGCIRYLDGDYSAAVDAFEQSGDIILDLLAWKAAALALAGEAEQAHHTMNNFIDAVSGRWQGEQKADKRNIKDWLIHCFPMKLQTDRKHLQKGLRRAGL